MAWQSDTVIYCSTRPALRIGCTTEGLKGGEFVSVSVLPSVQVPLWQPGSFIHLLQTLQTQSTVNTHYCSTFANCSFLMAATPTGLLGMFSLARQVGDKMAARFNGLQAFIYKLTYIKIIWHGRQAGSTRS